MSTDPNVGLCVSCRTQEGTGWFLSVFTSNGFVSSGAEEVVAFVWGEEAANASNCPPEVVICSGRDLADESLQL